MDNSQIACERIPKEDKPICECADCVRELKFKYTGMGCSSEFRASGKCADEGPNPFNAAYRITECEDPSEVIAAGRATKDGIITIGAPAGTCLPACLDATISVPNGAITQTFEIDAECGGERGLQLTSEYGSFQSVGYSCSETDTHNCFQDVTYDLEVCNIGSTDEKLYQFYLTVDKVEIDRLPSQDVFLSPGDCYDDTYTQEVDRCSALESCVNITANATNPMTGLPVDCSHEEEIKFGWDQPENPPPTQPPTPTPSDAPSLPPTTECIIEVGINGCPDYDPLLSASCEGRPQVMTFRHNGDDCSQSQNLQSRLKFTCVDFNGGPPRGLGTQNFIRVKAAKGTPDVFFEGPVAVGELFTLNEDKSFDRLSADMTIEILTSEGGTLLQELQLHLSCSEFLFIFDRFGATQVLEWVETDGRVVSVKTGDVPTGKIELEFDASSSVTVPVRLTEMNILINSGDPVDYTPLIAGVVLSPGQKIDLPGLSIDIDLSKRTSYTFFTTLIGETIDGSTKCNGLDFHECTVGFNLNPAFPTNFPTARPTLTAYPTPDPETTSCEIQGDITCSVLSLDGLPCDEIKAPLGTTCPPDAELLVAYMTYNGAFGEFIFLEVACDEKATYIDRPIRFDESFSIRTRANTCEIMKFRVYTSDPLQGGTLIVENSVQTACPGPWNLGAIIADAFILDKFIDTEDNGRTFRVYMEEVEVQLDYVAINTGSFPLVVTQADVAELYLGTMAQTSQSEQIGSIPVSMPPRSQNKLQSSVLTIPLIGKNGDVITWDLALVGQTQNEFALPCSDVTSLSVTL